MKYSLKILLILIAASAFTCFIRCKKEEDVVPYVGVDIYIAVSDPNFINLNAVGGWVYITGGARGIVVRRQSTAEFNAYDRNCTYKPSGTCARISVESSNIIAVDSCCGSKFLLTDGSVSNPPAVTPLKSYQTAFDGNILHVFN